MTQSSRQYQTDVNKSSSAAPSYAINNRGLRRLSVLHSPEFIAFHLLVFESVNRVLLGVNGR